MLFPLFLTAVFSFSLLFSLPFSMLFFLSFPTKLSELSNFSPLRFLWRALALPSCSSRLQTPLAPEEKPRQERNFPHVKTSCTAPSSGMKWHKLLIDLQAAFPAANSSFLCRFCVEGKVGDTSWTSPRLGDEPWSEISEQSSAFLAFLPIFVSCRNSTNIPTTQELKEKKRKFHSEKEQPPFIRYVWKRVLHRKYLGRFFKISTLGSLKDWFTAVTQCIMVFTWFFSVLWNKLGLCSKNMMVSHLAA